MECNYSFLEEKKMDSPIIHWDILKAAASKGASTVWIYLLIK
jgi:hypothetical protein